MANNVLIAKVVVKGSRPLWFHRFGPDSIPTEKQERTGVAGNDEHEWRKTVLVTKDGQLYIDGTYPFSCIVAGGKFIPKGRGSIQPLIAATLQVLDDRILVDRWFPGFPGKRAFDVKKVEAPPNDPDLPVYTDIRGVKNPTTKSRNVRYRIACSPGWQVGFRIQFDATVVARGQMESAIMQAGKLVGLGNGRTIGMGRFELVSFEIAS